MEEEIWKDIKGYETLYQVSNLGRLRSLDRCVAHSRGGTANLKGAPLKPAKSKNKYYTIGLTKLGIAKTFKVHKLVADAFLGIPEIGKTYINHINSDRFDNSVSNLEYVSPIENSIHSVSRFKSFVGAKFSKKNNKWESEIRYNDVYKWLGYFNTQELAYQARLDYMKANNIESKYL